MQHQAPGSSYREVTSTLLKYSSLEIAPGKASTSSGYLRGCSQDAEAYVAADINLFKDVKEIDLVMEERGNLRTR